MRHLGPGEGRGGKPTLTFTLVVCLPVFCFFVLLLGQFWSTGSLFLVEKSNNLEEAGASVCKRTDVEGPVLG